MALGSRERGTEALARGRLSHKRESAARQPVLAVFVHREDLDGNVACRRILLEMVEHRPTEHVRQKDVQRHGARREFTYQSESLTPPSSHEDFEAFISRQI